MRKVAILVTVTVIIHVECLRRTQALPHVLHMFSSLNLLLTLRSKQCLDLTLSNAINPHFTDEEAEPQKNKALHVIHPVSDAARI